GLGAGYLWTRLNNFSVTQAGGPFRFNTDATEGAFAWQAIVGASFPISGVPGLSATAEYRFMDILGGEKFGGLARLTPAGAPVATTLELHNQFNHMFLVGLRYAFN